MTILNRTTAPVQTLAEQTIDLPSLGGELVVRALGIAERIQHLQSGAFGMSNLRADVFGELDERAEQLASEADALRIAGEQCVANWATLNAR